MQSFHISHLALEELFGGLGLDFSEAEGLSLVREEGLIFLSFRARFTFYELYLDPVSLHILGLNTVPSWTEDFWALPRKSPGAAQVTSAPRVRMPRLSRYISSN